MFSLLNKMKNKWEKWAKIGKNLQKYRKISFHHFFTLKTPQIAHIFSTDIRNGECSAVTIPSTVYK